MRIMSVAAPAILGLTTVALDVELAVGETRWEEQFSAEARADGTTTGTRLVEQVWDEVVLQVAGAVLQSGLLDATVARAAPPPVDPVAAPASTKDPRLERLVEAWPHLNESTRNRILGIVEGAELAGGDR